MCHYFFHVLHLYCKSISQKMNGTRCVYYNGRLYSRSGKEFTGLDHIIADIQKFNLPNLVFDGELIRKNIDGKSDSENFQIGTGIANSCLLYTSDAADEL